MKIEFTPAVRRKTRARVALCGPSGSGKTYTALAFAHVFAPGSVALIDTEKESADGYEGLNGWHWSSFKPVTYEPSLLVDALAAAAAAGIGCVIIDSLSHFWMGTGGMLEQVDNAGRRSRSGNSFAGWKEMRPDERRMLDAITGYPGHVIVTMRTKTEWVIQDNDRGKKEPRRIGTKPEQREGIEYEFSVVADMDLDNVLTVTKTRVPPLKRAVVSEPGPDFAQTIMDWLNDGGEAAPDVNAYRDRAVEPYATREDLLGLLAEVESPRVNLAGATVVDDEGETVTLKNLIIRKGREASGLSSVPAPERPAQQEEPAQQSGPRRADRSEGTPQDDGFYVRPEPDAFNWATEDDGEAVAEFVAKLADTTTPAAVRLRRRDLELAKAGLKVTPETFAELDEAIGKREAEIKAEAA